MRTRVLLAGLLVFAVACGSKPTSKTGATSSPTAAASAAASAAPSGGAASGAPAATSKPAGGGSGAAQAGGAQAAPGVTPTKVGTYVYSTTGTKPNPTTGQQEPIKEGTTNTIEVAPHKQADGGTLVDFISKEQQATTTIHTRWHTDKVVLLSTSFQSKQATFECKNVPPTIILSLPLQPNTKIPTQKYKDGETCEGTLDTTIVGAEDVADANGKVWKAWKITSHTDSVYSGQKIAVDAVQWFAPELGTYVRNETTTTGKYKAPQGEMPFKVETKSLLKSHP